MAKKIIVSFIIPIFNEEKRLEPAFAKAITFLKKQFSNSFEMILVNDGSTDKTLEILEKLAQKNKSLVKVVSYTQNQGKGFAVKKGVEEAVGDIIGFTDADFAISLKDIKQIVKLLQTEYDIVIGDRNAKQSTIENEPNFTRRLFGSTLSFLNTIFLNLKGISDTQCGFKFFRNAVAKNLFKKSQIYGWLFDIELLINSRKQKYRIQKIPVEWKEELNSKVNIKKDLFGVGIQLLQIYFAFYPLRILSAILLFLLISIFLPFLIFPQNLTLRAGDYSDLVWPDYFFIKDSIYQHHQIPLWNPTVFSGIPEIANPQSPILYPPNSLALILPIDLAIVILLIIHFYVAGLFLYKFGENLKFSQLARGLLVFGFVFSPFLWSKASVGHLSQLFAITLLAPILYFGSNFFLAKKKIMNLFLLSLFLSLQYLNYPTIWYYTCFFGLLISTYLCLIHKRLKLLLGFFSASFLSLIFILPLFLIQLQAGPQITRSELSLSDLGLPIWSLKRFFLSVVTPSNFLADYETEVWLYSSVLLGLVSLWGLLKLKRKYALVILLSLLLIIVLTLGNRTPIFSFFTNYVPGFSYLRVTTRSWFIFVILVSLLGAYGIQKVSSRFKNILFAFIIFDLILFSAVRIWFVPPIMQSNSGTNFDYLLKETEDYRYYCTGRCLSASKTVPKNIATADGYHLIILKNYRKALSSAGGFDPTSYTGNIPAFDVKDAQPSAEELGKFNIKYLVSENFLEDPNFILLSSSCGYSLYENTKALARFRFRENNFNTIKVIKKSPNQIIVETNTEKSDRLILADPFYKGWEVIVDGKSQPIIEEDGWARGVDLSDGKHTVEFKFNPFGHLIEGFL